MQSERTQLRPFASDGTFAHIAPAAKDGKLRSLAVRGAGATLFAGGVTLGIQVIATIVLARLLSPIDFGIVAMVTTFSFLLMNCGFNGLTEAIVQREDLNVELASTLFWINFATGAVLTILFAEGGALLAWFFHSPPVRGVAAAISLSILAMSQSTVHLALLKRAMRFSALSRLEICARIVSVSVSIILGVLGYGYWALVVGVVAQPLTVCVGGWTLCQWMPGFPRRVAGTRSAVRFALNAYGNFAVNYLSRNTDNILVGWRFHAQSLGFYKKAYDLFALTATQFVSSVSIVIVVSLSRIRKDRALYRRYLFAILGLVAFLGMGLGAIFTVSGRDLILVILGAKWEPAGQIFRFFGPGVGIMILYSSHGWIHLSLGKPERWFHWAFVEFAVTLMLFIAGLRFGPIGIATAWSVSFWILTLPAIWYAGKPVGLEIRSVIRVVWKYVVASFVATVASIVLWNAPQFRIENPGTAGVLVRILASFTSVMTFYLGAVVLLHRGLAPLKGFLSLLLEMFGTAKDLAGAAAEEEETADSSAQMPGACTGAGNVENLPLVSILIPAYNVQEWIADSIRSALAQTWPRTEIIVVDDGSKDDTLRIARQFECQGVRVIAEKNQGASAARNNAFAHCRGDYIQWLDADDLLAPDKIARQMRVVLEGISRRTLLSGQWGYFMYRPHHAQFIPTDLWCDLTPEEWLLRKMAKNVFIQTAAWLVSRELTEAAGPWDVRMLGDDDGEYFCRVLMVSDYVKFVPDSAIYYRAFRFNGLSYIGRFPKKIEAHWLSMQLHIKYLLSFRDDVWTRAACVQYLRDNLAYFYPERSHIVAQAEQLASELGHPLGEPRVSWKYLWIWRACGWMVTKYFQQVVRRCRWGITRKVDYLLFKIERQFRPVNSSPLVLHNSTGAGMRPLAVKESQTT
jgi:PST family polysaccharide transporter